jgi:hypothetical protein
VRVRNWAPDMKTNRPAIRFDGTPLLLWCRGCCCNVYMFWHRERGNSGMGGTTIYQRDINHCNIAGAPAIDKYKYNSHGYSGDPLETKQKNRIIDYSSCRSY